MIDPVPGHLPHVALGHKAVRIRMPAGWALADVVSESVEVDGEGSRFTATCARSDGACLTNL